MVPGGDVTVRTIQKVLNQRFVAYTGLKACDGHYGRSTNEALIYAIQAEEGMPTDMATGFFGPSTKNYLPDLWQPGQWGMKVTTPTPRSSGSRFWRSTPCTASASIRDGV